MYDVCYQQDDDQAPDHSPRLFEVYAGKVNVSIEPKRVNVHMAEIIGDQASFCQQ